MVGQLFAEWWFFVGVMALGQFSPGPDMILLTRVSLREGRRAGYLVMLGIVSGLCLHSILAIGGMSALLRQGGWLESVLTILAASYLSWLGFTMIASFRKNDKSDSEHPQEEAFVKSQKKWFQQGFFCNLLNPKVVVFFAGVTTLFLRNERPDWWPFLLGLTIVLEGLLLWGLWVLVLQNLQIRRLYRRASKWLDLGFALALWLLYHFLK